MSKAYTEISAGLTDAIFHAKGNKSKARVHRPKPINVKAIREKTGMSQQRFCATFGISLGRCVIGSKVSEPREALHEYYLKLLITIQEQSSRL